MPAPRRFSAIWFQLFINQPFMGGVSVNNDNASFRCDNVILMDLRTLRRPERVFFRRRGRRSAQSFQHGHDMILRHVCRGNRSGDTRVNAPHLCGRSI
jgi:hypothetical protein